MSANSRGFFKRQILVALGGQTVRTLPRTVLFLHSSAGGYGADRQLLALAGGLDPNRYNPVVALPERGSLAAQLERYVLAHRQQVIAAVEHWWDNYEVTTQDIEAERDGMAERLSEYLRALGYAG